MVNRPKKELAEDAIELRREKVLELTSQGYSQRQISNMLNISHGTVGNDQIFLRQKAKENIRRYIDERLPEEYEKCLVGVNAINREAWNIAQNAEDNKEKIQALSLAKECYSMKLDLLTNAAVIEDAGRFMQEKKKELEQQQQQSSSLLLQRQQMEQPPQETKQEQQQEQEPETFNKTF